MDATRTIKAEFVGTAQDTSISGTILKANVSFKRSRIPRMSALPLGGDERTKLGKLSVKHRADQGKRNSENCCPPLDWVGCRRSGDRSPTCTSTDGNINKVGYRFSVRPRGEADILGISPQASSK